MFFSFLAMFLFSFFLYLLHPQRQMLRDRSQCKSREEGQCCKDVYNKYKNDHKYNIVSSQCTNGFIHSLLARREPAIASCATMAIYLPKNIAIPVVTFQNTLLSASPQNRNHCLLPRKCIHTIPGSVRGRMGL